MMEIQMLLMLLAASWLCCDAVSIDQKTRLYHDVLRDYVRDIEPPLTEGVANLTYKMGLYLRCATPGDDGLVLIEASHLIVSIVGVWLTMVSAVFSDFVALWQSFSCRLA